MRARNVKPDFLHNEDLAELDPLCRLLFLGLWMECDRSGVFEDRPKRIKLSLLPWDECCVEEMLDFLCRKEFLRKFTADGRTFFWIPMFRKHQHPHHKEPFRFPIPEEECCRTESEVFWLKKILEEWGKRPDLRTGLPEATTKGGVQNPKQAQANLGRVQGKSRSIPGLALDQPQPSPKQAQAERTVFPVKTVALDEPQPSPKQAQAIPGLALDKTSTSPKQAPTSPGCIPYTESLINIPNTESLTPEPSDDQLMEAFKEKLSQLSESTEDEEFEF